MLATPDEVSLVPSATKPSSCVLPFLALSSFTLRSRNTAVQYVFSLYSTPLPTLPLRVGGFVGHGNGNSKGNGQVLARLEGCAASHLPQTCPCPCSCSVQVMNDGYGSIPMRCNGTSSGRRSCLNTVLSLVMVLVLRLMLIVLLLLIADC